MTRSTVRFAALAIFAVSLAGCGPGGAGLAALVVLAALVLGACAESREMSGDAGTIDARASADAGGDAQTDAGGIWVPCCQDGHVATCFCPADVSCNYGLGLVVCPDGRCTYDYADDPDAFCLGPDGGSLDGGLPDAGEPGEWEPCCNEGRIDLCFCPAGAACNYGLFEDCGDGFCASPPGSGCPG